MGLFMASLTACRGAATCRQQGGTEQYVIEQGATRLEDRNITRFAQSSKHKYKPALNVKV